VFAEREPGARARIRQTVRRFTELQFALGSVTAPLLAELGVDAAAVAGRVAEEVPRRFARAGLDASEVSALAGLGR
jgi:hypothetical protein